jgi:3-oxoacyl-[acyl-carrier protein] reductase
MQDLVNKVVLITGASTGIGAAAALAFGKAGARVVVHFNASKSEAEAVVAEICSTGGVAVAIGGDVTLSGTPEKIVVQTVAEFGRIDVLVNNAGGLVKRTSIAEYTDEFVLDVLRLNVVQVSAFVRSVVPIMRAQGSGNIINVSSVAARNGGRIGSGIYAASKGFISTATRNWARELVVDNIRVNAVAPGIIMTPFHTRDTPAQELAKMQATVPMNRIGEPAECAQSMLFLASDAMSSYITGQVIEVNGGVSMP